MKTSTSEKLYTFAQLNDCGKNLNKQWFVYFSYRNPKTGKLKRFRIYEGLGNAKTFIERNRVAKLLILKTNRRLNKGYNPFENKKCVYKPISPVEPAKTLMAVSIQEHLTNIIKEESASIRKATIQAYQSQVKGLCKWLKENNLTSLSVQDYSLEHAGRFLNHITVDLNRHTTTRNTYRTNLKHLFNLLKEKKVILINPFDGTKKVPTQKTSQKHYRAHQRNQLKACISRADPELWLFIQFMFYCFIRPKELLGLKIEDIDIERGQIEIRGSISKNKKTQPVSIPDVFLGILMKERLHVHAGNLLLFGKYGYPGVKPRSKNHFNRKHSVILKGLGYGKGYSLYSWKHTGIMMLYEKTKDIKAVQQQARHHSLDQTNEYLKNLGVMDNENLKSGFPEL